jgi:SanA protein
MKIEFTKKLFWRISISGFIVLLVFVMLCNFLVNKNAKGKLYNSTNEIPYQKVGLLLGTGKYLSNGNINMYYKYRIEAATALLKANKIKYLIISGDNSKVDYDEPTTMRNDLIKNGVDSTLIYLDFAGFRTFDSMIRLKEIFGQDSVTIISQQFHNERAIYIAKQNGIAAIGYNAKDVEKYGGLKTKFREKFARTKLFLDHWFGKKPKYLGDKVVLPS